MQMVRHEMSQHDSLTSFLSSAHGHAVWLTSSVRLDSPISLGSLGLPRLVSKTRHSNLTQTGFRLLRMSRSQTTLSLKQVVTLWRRQLPLVDRITVGRDRHRTISTHGRVRDHAQHSDRISQMACQKAKQAQVITHGC